MMMQLKLAAIALVLGAICVLYYQNWAKDQKIETLISEITVERVERVKAVAARKSMQKQILDVAAVADSINAAMKEVRIEVQKNKKIFDDHDFTRLLQAKPKMIERRMRSGTNSMFGKLEEAANAD